MSMRKKRIGPGSAIYPGGKVFKGGRGFYSQLRFIGLSQALVALLKTPQFASQIPGRVESKLRYVIVWDHYFL